MRHHKGVFQHHLVHEQRQRPSAIRDPSLVANEDVTAIADHALDELPSDEAESKMREIAVERDVEKPSVKQTQRRDQDGQRQRQPQRAQDRAAVVALDVLDAHRHPQFPPPDPFDQVKESELGGRRFPRHHSPIVFRRFGASSPPETVVFLGPVGKRHAMHLMCG